MLKTYVPLSPTVANIHLQKFCSSSALFITTTQGAFVTSPHGDVEICTVKLWWPIGLEILSHSHVGMCKNCKNCKNPHMGIHIAKAPCANELSPSLISTWTLSLNNHLFELPSFWILCSSAMHALLFRGYMETLRCLLSILKKVTISIERTMTISKPRTMSVDSMSVEMVRNEHKDLSTLPHRGGDFCNFCTSPHENVIESLG